VYAPVPPRRPGTGRQAAPPEERAPVRARDLLAAVVVFIGALVATYLALVVAAQSCQDLGCSQAWQVHAQLYVALGGLVAAFLMLALTWRGAERPALTSRGITVALYAAWGVLLPGALS
jgi:hypothetical protein